MMESFKANATPMGSYANFPDMFHKYSTLRGLFQCPMSDLTFAK